MKVFEIRRPDPLFRFADAATGRMDAGAEAAGVHGRVRGLRGIACGMVGAARRIVVRWRGAGWLGDLL